MLANKTLSISVDFLKKRKNEMIEFVNVGVLAEYPETSNYTPSKFIASMSFRLVKNLIPAIYLGVAPRV